MHGRSRVSVKAESEGKAGVQKKAAAYRRLQNDVLQHHKEKVYTPTALEQCARLLELNPDVYSAWNYRKAAVTFLLSPDGGLADDDPKARVKVANDELRLVERALAKNPKSYGAWFHRKWIIRLGLSPVQREFDLLAQLLTLDNRNFHGWDYRRFVVQEAGVTAGEELEYSVEKIAEEPRNYSAWHARSWLLNAIHSSEPSPSHPTPAVTLSSPEASLGEARLREEFELVKQALWTAPEDQSGFMYYHWLLAQATPRQRPSLLATWPGHGMAVPCSVAKEVRVSTNENAPRPLHDSTSELKSVARVDGEFARQMVVLAFSEPVGGLSDATVAVSWRPSEHSLPEPLLSAKLSQSTVIASPTSLESLGEPPVKPCVENPSEGFRVLQLETWKALGDASQGFSHTWKAEVWVPLPAGKESRGQVSVRIGVKEGISTSAGLLLNPSQYQFAFDLVASDCSEPPEKEDEETFLQEAMACMRLTDGGGGGEGGKGEAEGEKAERAEGGNVKESEDDKWRVDLLEAEIDMCRELMQVEEENVKWPKVSLAHLLEATRSHLPTDIKAGPARFSEDSFDGPRGLDREGGSTPEGGGAAGGERDEEILLLYKQLREEDPAHREYYRDQMGRVRLRQILSSLQLRSSLSNKNAESAPAVLPLLDETATSEVGSEALPSPSHSVTSEEEKKAPHPSTSSSSLPRPASYGAGLSLSGLGLGQLEGGGLHRFLWLRHLDLSHNNLRSAHGLESLPLLRFLDLSHNSISHSSALLPLAHLPYLHTLRLSHNALGEAENDSSRYSNGSPALLGPTMPSPFVPPPGPACLGESPSSFDGQTSMANAEDEVRGGELGMRAEGGREDGKEGGKSGERIEEGRVVGAESGEGGDEERIEAGKGGGENGDKTSRDIVSEDVSIGGEEQSTDKGGDVKVMNTSLSRDNRMSSGVNQDKAIFHLLKGLENLKALQSLSLQGNLIMVNHEALCRTIVKQTCPSLVWLDGTRMNGKDED
eukprot:TRINITY_DN18053_c0_g2_i2.p1 TRINITY_DN18053_c0_g2~~TRINITY_DN18053_c0_g2_i2.p1  ORF type:complete len:995 (-),score=177.31 TRINITY_DN18053_c0_g2_i2:376-3360(-)